MTISKTVKMLNLYHKPYDEKKANAVPNSFLQRNKAL